MVRKWYSCRWGEWKEGKGNKMIYWIVIKRDDRKIEEGKMVWKKVKWVNLMREEREDSNWRYKDWKGWGKCIWREKKNDMEKNGN